MTKGPKAREQRSRSRPPRTPDLTAAALLTSPCPGRSVLKLGPKATVFWQGEPAAAVYYIHSGSVQLVIISGQGKEAVVAILSAGDFFGEACIGGQTIYHASAITMAPSTIVKVESDAMRDLLSEQPAISEAFMRFLLSRNLRIEADLVDQLFNSSERRLARVLLLLANFGANTKTGAAIPWVSQDVLAAKVGTTRSRINFFMNKFRKLGLVEYDKASRMLKVHPALFNIIIQD